MLRYIPWSWLAPLAFLPAVGLGDEARRKLACLVGTIGCAWVANLVLLACFFGTTDRYLTDYVPAALLLGGVGALALAARTNARPVRRKLVATGFLVAAIYSIFVELVVLAPALPRPEAVLALARWADGPTSWWERARGTQFGALRLDLALPVGREGLTEPLLETGPAPDRRDWTEIQYLTATTAKISVFHAGLGLVEGRAFPIPPGRRISVEIQSSGLLPPRAHPIFSGWTSDEYEAVNRDLRVSVDGVETLRAALAGYPSPPSDLRIGRVGWPADGINEPFSGQVLSSRRLPLAPPARRLPEFPGRLPVDLQVVFPADHPAAMEPLLSVGHGQESDLVYAIYEGPGRLRLAFDHADSGGPRGEVFTYDPVRPHRLEIWMGSWAGADAMAGDGRHLALARRVVVTMDGTAVLNAAGSFFRADPKAISVGTNPFLSTLIAHRFGGLVLATGQAADFGGLPELQASGEFGAVDLRVLFPKQVLGTAEPLVVTGMTGAGDLLYVRYVDSAHVAFGFDHWGVGGLTGAVVPVDYGRPHRLEITLGSLYAVGEAGAWARRVRVKLDGVVVLDGASACHPTSPQDIQIGKNPIGGSTCGFAFSGRILGLTRAPRPAE
jgi:hypothetical protein